MTEVDTRQSNPTERHASTSLLRRASTSGDGCDYGTATNIVKATESERVVCARRSGLDECTSPRWSRFTGSIVGGITGRESQLDRPGSSKVGLAQARAYPTILDAGDALKPLQCRFGQAAGPGGRTVGARTRSAMVVAWVLAPDVTMRCPITCDKPRHRGGNETRR